MFAANVIFIKFLVDVSSIFGQKTRKTKLFFKASRFSLNLVNPQNYAQAHGFEHFSLFSVLEFVNNS